MMNATPKALALLGAAFLSVQLLGGEPACADPGPIRLVLGETKAIDQATSQSRVDPSAFKGALKFILGSDSSMEVVDLADNASGTLPDGYRLESTLQTFRESVIWLGELRRIDKDLPGATDPIPLGPIVLADEKGLKPAALNQIVALVKRQLSGEAVGANKPISIYACLQPDSSPFARRIAEEFRQSFALVLTSPDVVAVQPPPPCLDVSGPLPENSARVVGQVTQQTDGLKIEPFLQWKDNLIPLPTFAESLEGISKSGQIYIQMLSRATLAAFHDYPAGIVSAFRNSNGWDDTRYIFELENYPYLKIAALQRRSREDGLDVYEIGRAFLNAKEPELAKRAFSRATELKPEWKDPYRELGTVLLELQQYDAAEAALKKAVDIDAHDGRIDPDTMEKYAQVAFLMGKTDDARRVLDEMFQSSDGTFRARLLAVRIALLRGDIDNAIANVKVAKRLPGGDPPLISELVRSIANRILESHPDQTQLEAASAALDLVPETSGDAMLFALKGKVRLSQGLLVDSGGDLATRARAHDKITDAIAYYRRVAGASSANPEFAVIDLDISEALFFAASYATDDAKRKADLRESIAGAQAMLKKDDPRGLGLASYRPVAMLLIAAGDYLQTMNSDPRPQFQRQLAELADIRDDAHLSINVPTGKQSVNIRVAQWSFSDFDTTACRLQQPARQVIMDLSAFTKKKVSSLQPQLCSQ